MQIKIVATGIEQEWTSGKLKIFQEAIKSGGGKINEASDADLSDRQQLKELNETSIGVRRQGCSASGVKPIRWSNAQPQEVDYDESALPEQPANGQEQPGWSAVRGPDLIVCQLVGGPAADSKPQSRQV